MPCWKTKQYNLSPLGNEIYFNAKNISLFCLPARRMLQGSIAYLSAWISEREKAFNYWFQNLDLSVINFVCIPYFRVVNVSSALGALNNLSPVLQQKFASPKLTVSDIEELMEKYIRWDVYMTMLRKVDYNTVSH